MNEPFPVGSKILLKTTIDEKANPYKLKINHVYTVAKHHKYYDNRPVISLVDSGNLNGITFYSDIFELDESEINNEFKKVLMSRERMLDLPI